MRCITAVACAALALAALSGGAEARVGEQSPAAWAHPFARHKVGERQLSLDDDPYSTYCPDYLCGPGEYCASEGFTFYCECHISYAVTLLAGLTSLCISINNGRMFRMGIMTEAKYKIWIYTGCGKIALGIFIATALCRGIPWGVVAILFGMLWVVRGVMGVRLISYQRANGLVSQAAPPAVGGAPPTQQAYAQPVPVAQTYETPPS